jgi:hypothetical protein
MKDESQVKYFVGLGVALVVAIALYWQLSDFLCPPEAAGRGATSSSVSSWFGCRRYRIRDHVRSHHGTLDYIRAADSRCGYNSIRHRVSSPAADGIAQARAAYDRGYASLQQGDLQGAIREFDWRSVSIPVNTTRSLHGEPPMPTWSSSSMQSQTMTGRSRWIREARRRTTIAVAAGRTSARLSEPWRTSTRALRLRPDYMIALYARGHRFADARRERACGSRLRQALSLASDDSTRERLQSRLAALGANP